MHTAYAACKYDDCASTALTMQDLWLNPDYLLYALLLSRNLCCFPPFLDSQTRVLWCALVYIAW